MKTSTMRLSAVLLINAALLALYVCGVLALSYFIGALLGKGVGAVRLGQLLGCVIGVVALLGWWFQPEPTRRERWLAIKHSVRRGDWIVNIGYTDAGAFVYVGFVMVIFCAALCMGVIWIFS